MSLGRRNDEEGGALKEDEVLRSQHISDSMIFALNNKSSGVVKFGIFLIVNPANEKAAKTMISHL